MKLFNFFRFLVIPGENQSPDPYDKWLKYEFPNLLLIYLLALIIIGIIIIITLIIGFKSTNNKLSVINQYMILEKIRNQEEKSNIDNRG